MTANTANIRPARGIDFLPLVLLGGLLLLVFSDAIAISVGALHGLGCAGQ